jgi:subtilisin family serine protease
MLDRHGMKPGSANARIGSRRFALRRALFSTVLVGTFLAGCAQESPTPAASRAEDAEPAAIRTAAKSVPGHDLGLPKDFPGTQPRRSYVPGELLVKFRPGTAKYRADNALRSAAVRFSRGYRTLPGLLRVSISPEKTVEAARAQLERSPEVEYAEPNYLYYPAAVPNDEWFRVQDGLHRPVAGEPDWDIDAPEAWDITTGSDDLVVAIFDTGIHPLHEDIAGNLFRNTTDCDLDGTDDDANGYVDDCSGIDAFENDSDPTDYTIHGTHVAGTIGAVTNNDVGVAGVAWDVRLLPCRFIDFNLGGALADAIECFDYVASLKDRGVNVIATNNSWSGIFDSRALNDAVAGHLDRGILTMASASNDSLDNDREPVFPCNIDHANVICVASAHVGGAMSHFSNYGLTSVHLAAPGEWIYNATSGSGTTSNYDYLSGTSMATPHVTGVAVLLAAQDPSRDWREIKNLLLTGAEVFTESPRRTITSARLNALGSLTCSGKRVIRRRLPHFLNHEVSIGTAIPLRALHIRCGQPDGNITVTVSPTGETIVLADDGLGPDEVAGDGEYNAAWIAPAGGDYVLSFQDPIGSKVNVRVDPYMKPGFPLKGMDSGWFAGFWDGPGHEVIAGNIDADPELEVLIPSVSAGPLFAYNHDGTAVPGWPLIDNGGQPYVALGEFDGDTTHAEVANNNLWTFGVSLYDGNGVVLPGGWPKTGRILVPPSTHDLDGDGLDEVILYPAYRADGSVFNPDTLVPTYGPEGGGQGGSPASIAAGDTDGDGLPELASARYGSGVFLSNAADVLYGFPAPFPATDDLDGWQLIPVIGDVDADGAPEIVVVTNRRGTDESFKGYVHVFSNRGVRERTLEMPTRSPLAMAPVLADLDSDGVPEILVQNAQRIYAWKGDGSAVPGWPVFLGANSESFFVSPVVGDVDGDGLPDIVTTAGDTSAPWAGTLYIFHRDGRPHDGYPRPLLSFRFGMAAAIADIDLDGRNDLLVAPTSVPGVSETLYGYDYNNGNPSGPIEWGQYMEGPENRGYYELGKNLRNSAYVTAHAHGHGRITAEGGAIDCGADCIARYQKGRNVILHASPGPGATFDRWLGACTGQGNPCTVAVDGFKGLAARFHTPVELTIEGSGSGSVRFLPDRPACTDDCSRLFEGRSVVTLTAEPADGVAFTGWAGACRGRDRECRLSMDEARSVTAKFASELRLTVSLEGTGSGEVISNPAGIQCGSTCSAWFLPERVVALTPTAASDSEFREWTGDACVSRFTVPCQVTMDRTKTVGAVFDTKPVVTVTSRGGGRVTSSPGGIDCGTDCSAPFAFDELIGLTATPDEGASFVGWSGDCEGTHTTCSLPFVDAPRHVEAQFTGRPSILVYVAGGGYGRVTSEPNGIDCTTNCIETFADATSLELHAVPDKGSRFVRWEGACAGTQTTCRFVVQGSTTVEAVFELITTGGGGGGGGGGDGSGGGGALGWLSLLALGWMARRRPATP